MEIGKKKHDFSRNKSSAIVEFISDRISSAGKCFIILRSKFHIIRFLPFSLVKVNGRFGEIYRFHLQGQQETSIRILYLETA
jgi:hypothetical protein